MAILSPVPRLQFLDILGNIASGFKLFTFLPDGTTPQITYADAAQTVANANPIILDSRGEAVVFLPESSTFTYRLENASGVTQYTQAGIAAPATSSTFSGTSGSASIGHIGSETGSVAITVQSKLRAQLFAKEDFGATGDGATDDTNALKAFYDACILTGKVGYIGPGTYQVTAGILKFDNLQVQKSFPTILTAGAPFTKFRVISNAAASVIEFTNGAAAQGTTNFWEGGYHGGIEFVNTFNAFPTSLRGAISLSGVRGTRFGPMRGIGWSWGLLYIAADATAGSQVSKAVTGCHFEGLHILQGLTIPSSHCILNSNFSALRSCVFEDIRADDIPTAAAVISGIGQSNVVRFLSVKNHAGFAIHGGRDGSNSTQLGGGGLVVQNALLDNVKRCFQFPGQRNITIQQCRIIFRRESGLNTATTFWPDQIIASQDGAFSPILLDVELNASLEIPLTTGTSGFSSALMGGMVGADRVTCRYTIEDVNNQTVTDAQLSSGASAGTRVKRDGFFLKNAFPPAVYWHAGKQSAAVNVKNTGFLTSGNNLIFNSVIANTNNVYDSTTGRVTVPTTGTYALFAKVQQILTAGNRCRSAFVNAALTVYLRTEQTQVTSAVTQSYTLHGLVNLTAGDTILLNMDQNSGADVAINTLGSVASTESYWYGYLINPDF